MKKIIVFTFTLLFVLLIRISAFAQPVSAEYADDEIIMIFEDNTTQAEIDNILNYFAMHIEAGPTPFTKAYLLKFDSVPPPWAYSNPIDPINGIIEHAQTQSSTNGAGLNFKMNQPATKDGSGGNNEENRCYTLFDRNINQDGGNNVKVGIFDTGINPTENIISNFFDILNLGFNYINFGETPIDDNGHGTHISSIIMEHLNNENGIINIEAHKTHDIEGLGYVFDAIQALDNSIHRNVDVVNMSFSFNLDFEHRYDDFAPFPIAIEKAKELGGILCVASAGNEGVNNDNYATFSAYPASYLNDNILAVASVGCNRKKSLWSNFGVSSVDIAAPGEGIWGYDHDGELIQMSGTSQATAFVSKVAIFLATYQNTFDYELTKCAILTGVTPLLGNNPFVGSNGYVNPQEALSVLNSSAPCIFIPPYDDLSNRMSAPETLAIKYLNSNQNLNFEIASKKSQKVKVLISNIAGEQLLAKEIELSAGSKIYDFEFQRKVEMAIYFISVITEDEVVTLKFR